MVAKFIACFFALFTVSYAATTVKHVNELPIEGIDFLAATPSPSAGPKTIRRITKVSRQEMASMALASSETGFGRIAEAGVSVTRGASATASFDIEVSAVDAETLDRNDESFFSALSESEQAEFLELKESFEGGLDVPMIEFTGADIREDLSKEELVEKRESSEEFRKREQALTNILETVADTRIRITGTLTATGVSQIPTVAFAFVRLARIEFEDGTSQLVVSNMNEDIIAADADGDAVGTSDQESDILCVSGFIC